jgi:fluoroquinolone transport system permease protein
MNINRFIYTTGGNDVKLLGRDRFLPFMFLFGLMLAGALRYILPWIDGNLAAGGIMPGSLTEMRFSDFYPLAVAHMVIYSGASLVGAIYGFMLLDERDNHTITSMMITPISLNCFVMYRIGSCILLSFFMIMAMVYITGIALLPVWQMLMIAAAASLAAPILAIFYATVAENKVQGFAYAKFGGIAAWTILIGWFIADPWQWLFGVFSPFLISKAYWMALGGDSLWWLALGLGIVLQSALIGWQVQCFKRVIQR